MIAHIDLPLLIHRESNGIPKFGNLHTQDPAERLIQRQPKERFVVFHLQSQQKTKRR
jgi:hypothetical protein